MRYVVGIIHCVQYVLVQRHGERLLSDHSHLRSDICTVLTIRSPTSGYSRQIWDRPSSLPRDYLQDFAKAGVRRAQPWDDQDIDAVALRTPIRRKEAHICSHS
jgi:hypothetical protein